MSSGDFPDRGAFILINHNLTQLMGEFDSFNCSDMINPNKFIFGELELLQHSVNTMVGALLLNLLLHLPQ